MTLRGNDLLLTVLGLLAIGLAGAEAGAQNPPPTNLACGSYNASGCVTFLCVAVTPGTCANGLSYNRVDQLPVAVGSCSILSYGSNCVMQNVTNCDYRRYNAPPGNINCLDIQPVCTDSTKKNGC